MKIARWLALVPAALIAGFAASVFAAIPLCIAHGWSFISELLDAPDMAGHYIVGTYCSVLIRGAMGAASTWAAARVAPSRKLQTAYGWFVLLAIAAFGIVAWVNLALGRAHLQFTFSGGYRFVLEIVSLLGGAGFTIAVLRDELPRSIRATP
jgi:hypothetical protein